MGLLRAAVIEKVNNGTLLMEFMYTDSCFVQMCKTGKLIFIPGQFNTPSRNNVLPEYFLKLLQVWGMVAQ